MFSGCSLSTQLHLRWVVSFKDLAYLLHKNGVVTDVGNSIEVVTVLKLDDLGPAIPQAHEIYTTGLPATFPIGGCTETLYKV